MPKETFFNLPADKRDHILEIAIEEFAENDYQNVSISRLVERAGIAKGSFYQYFEDKEDLYSHLLDLAAQEKLRLLDTPPPEPGMGLFPYLRWLAETGLRFEVAFPRLSQVAYRAVTGTGLPAGFVQSMREQGLAYFRSLIALGKEQGDIRPDIDEELAAFLFNTVFNELGHYLVQRARETQNTLPNIESFYQAEPVQTLLDQTLTILEHGVAAPQSGENDEEH